VDEVAAVILSAGLEAASAYGGLVARAIENGQQLEVISEVGDTKASALAAARLRVPGNVVEGRLRVSFDAHTPLCDAMRSRSAMWLQSPGEIRALYPEHASFFEEAGYGAVVVLPLVSRGDLIGGLRLSFSEARTFDAVDRAFLTAFALQCALALDRAQLYEEALAARDLAEHATGLRDEFLDIVAHDLANPLSAIGLWAALVLESALAGAEGEKVKKGASHVQKAVRRMAALLRDLGDVASIDSGHLRIVKQDGNAEAIVTEVVAAYAPLCVEKELSLSGKAPALRIPCDPDRVQQVLGNLVGNALKFTPSGGKITIEAVPLGGEVRFSVADTGPGISEEAREHIFERYWRGKERDLTKGVGLGLFIAKSIIDSHVGKIWVESTVGRGSTFCFTLPIAPATTT
jgi:signal transduction histidine kinase